MIITNNINKPHIDKIQTDIISPVDGEKISEIRFTTIDGLENIVKKAEEAFQKWSSKTLKSRTTVLFNYRDRLEKNRHQITDLIRKENGKTIDEADAEVSKAIEVVEFATSLQNQPLGVHLEVSKGVFCQSTREPLGVVSSITPFNFPCMVPNWTIPIALVLGNAMILKPSEKTPLTAHLLADILKDSGLPDNVFQVVDGGENIVNAICEHPQIKAISFVGSTNVAKLVYQKATHHLKSAVCLGGAKNHLLVLPDANPDMTASNVVASMSGCAGQRCMAASVMVGVGNIDNIVKLIVDKSKKLVLGKDIGAVITSDSVKKIEAYITEAIEQGANVLLDGRGSIIPETPNGFYVGPTVLDNVTPDMQIAKEEVFGPVLSIIRTHSIDEALNIQNASLYANGASVYTNSGSKASYVSSRLQAGMVGINIGIPVPREPFSFGGVKESKFGSSDITGESSIHFWTSLKKVTTKWNAEDQIDWMS
ncbi:methylmalonate-semialdehyde dehydrogenase (CoA acylating) [Candidatus Marinamargulisbacteria bacterium SCGC AAA071-K20]|nr:methylmalonate-semialdehyde dehydrogenase (CoA acylating) [Candidatus Marinamargulisbacteria bacterium SCGC AAA071-K20]